jgi:catechol 2,3-dioxygenase
MAVQVRGVRSVEIELADPERAADFYTRVWHLTEVERAGGSIYFRGTGRHHHILAIHPAKNGLAIRRIVFDAASKAVVDQLCQEARAKAPHCQEPHALSIPGGGYGFGLADERGCNFAVVCDAKDHADAADAKDRPRKIAHINLNTPDIKASADFLTGALGFKLIDETAALWFFHCDSTDHSSMVMGPSAKPTLNHVAFEFPDLDSVMRGAGRMRDNGYPIEWGVGRHGAGNNVFAYFAGPEEFPLEYTAEVMQVDDSYTPHGPAYWKWPPGRLDQWGVTPPHTARWKRIQDMVLFTPGAWAV